MEKSKFHVLIKHYFLRGKSVKETEEKLVKYYIHMPNVFTT